MSARKMVPAALALAATVLLFPATAFSAPQTPAPAWSLQMLAGPTNFVAGDESGLDRYEVVLTNHGGAASDGSPITITDTLPAGLVVKDVELRTTRQPGSDFGPAACKTETAGEVATVTCEVEESLPGAEEPAKLDPSAQLRVTIYVATPASILPPETEEVELVNRAEVQGGGAQPIAAEGKNQVSDGENAAAGFQYFQTHLTAADGSAVTAAASHPFQYTTSFAVNLNPAPPGSDLPFVPAGGDLKRVEVALPPGLIANPTAVGRCTAQEFNTTHGVSRPQGGNAFQNECPDSSAVGVVAVQQLEGAPWFSEVPIYNLVPPKGMPAQLGFQPVLGLPVYIDTALRSGPRGLAVRAFVRNITEAKRLTAAEVTIWGTPADALHDPQRGQCAQVGGSCPAGIPKRPFMRLPSSCGSALATTMSFETWLHPGVFLSATDTDAPPSACNQLPFAPTIEARPTTNVADSPSGLHVDLHLPQKDNEDPEGVGHADLRDATVTLPAGLVVNPASAGGLGACSAAEIGLTSSVGQGAARFSDEPPSCPDAAKIGTVEVDTPLVDHPLPGAVYLARQSENPFGSLIAIYIVIHDPQTGVVVKLAGEVSPDPLTGRLSTTVSQGPQTPFEDFRFDFFEGARAPLRTPATCGESPTTPHTTTTSLIPWSAPEGATATPSDSFQIVQAPGGGPCALTKAALPNAPSFEAGTADPLAGAYSPFLLRLKREDGSQELKGLNVGLPTGLTARLVGTAECREAGVAQAQSRSNPGEGATEQASPSCPASSQLGTVTVGAGAGPTPFYATGKAYLAGPYKGAPLSMLIVTPAVAGPFDLGSVAVRAALRVHPETTEVTVASDPIPTILQGIPLDVRSIAVRIDRPEFTLNPTSCEAKALTAEAIAVSGQVANLQNRFQVGGCSNLGFKPRLALRLKGGTKRGSYPALTATLTYPAKGAYSNIAKAKVALPHSEFLAQQHIKTICTRVQFAAGTCPRGSIYGHAKAITPLLDEPLQGPVYLRSSSNPLPDLVADLNGQIHVALVGRVDSVNGGIRTSFEAVPDAPVSKFTLSMRGARKGLLVNSTNICKGTHKATVRFTAQNGKTLELRPKLQAKCKGKAKQKRKHAGQKHRALRPQRP